MKWSHLSLSAALLAGNSHAQSHDFSFNGNRGDAPMKILLPAIHEDTDLNHPGHMKPKDNLSLFYGEKGAHSGKASTFASLDINFKYPAVALENYGAGILSVDCQGPNNHGIDITFKNSEGLSAAAKSWPKGSPFLLITHHDGCGNFKAGARSYHYTTGFNVRGNTISTTSAEKELIDVCYNGTLSWGGYTPHNNPKYNGTFSNELRRRQDTGSVGGNDFDPQLDAAQGFFDLSAADDLISNLLPGIDPADEDQLNQQNRDSAFFDANENPADFLADAGVATEIVTAVPTETTIAATTGTDESAAAPTGGTRRLRSRDMMNKLARRSRLQKRGFFSRLLKSAAKFVNNVVNTPAKIVTTVTAFVQNPSISTFADIVKASPVGTVLQFAGGVLIGEVSAQGQATFAMDVPGPSVFKREATPWGPGIRVFRETSTVGTNTQAQATLWCVGCGLTGTITVSGKLTFDAGSVSITQGTVNIKGAMQFQLVAGFQAQFQYAKKNKFNIASANIGPFKIPGVAEAGFFVDLSLNHKFSVSAVGELQAGFQVVWPDLDSTLDLVNGRSSNLGKFTNPTFHPIFDARGELSIAAEVGPALGLSFGITVVGISTKISVVEAPSLEAKAAIVKSTNPSQCSGVDLSFSVINHVYISLVALGGTEKTFDLDKRTLDSKTWCLSPRAPSPKLLRRQDDAPADPADGGDAPAATSSAAAASTEAAPPAATSDAAPIDDSDLQDFVPTSTALNDFATLPADVLTGTETADITGSVPFGTVATDAPLPTDDAEAVSDAVLLSQESVNDVLNSNSDELEPNPDNAAHVNFAAVTTTDNSGTAMIPGHDGNLYAISLFEMQKTQDEVASWQAFGESIMGDISNRILHVYKDNVEALGVSRIRLSPLEKIPLQAIMVGMKSIDGALVAIDTLKRYYALATCEVTVGAEAAVSRVFAIDMGQKSIEEGIAALENTDNVASITGGNTTACAVVPWQIVIAQALPDSDLNAGSDQ